MTHVAGHTNPNESATEYEIRIAEGGTGSAGGTKTGPATLPGAPAAGPIIVTGDGRQWQIQVLSSSDPAVKSGALPRYVGRALDNGETQAFGPGEYVTNDAKIVTFSPNGDVSEGRTLRADEQRALGFPFDILGGGEGGGGGGGSVAGTSAPDPYAAASLLLQQYDTEIAKSNGTFSAEQAFAEFQTKWESLKADIALTTQGQQIQQTGDYLVDARERELAEASRRLRSAEEAGSRAGTIARDILPNVIPGATAVNFPLLGKMPLPQVNLGQLFSQGGAGDLNAIPPISPSPSIPFSPVQAPPLGPRPNFPAPPQYPQAPNINPFVNAAAEGFAGFTF
jgi:hypothetical protein